MVSLFVWSVVVGTQWCATGLVAGPARRRPNARRGATRRLAAASPSSKVDEARAQALVHQALARETRDGGEYKKAIRLYRAVVQLEPEAWQGWADLSAVMIEAAAPAVQTIKCLQRSIVAMETDESPDRASPTLLAAMYYEFGSKMADLTPEQQTKALFDDELYLEIGAADVLTANAINALTAAITISGGTMPLAEHVRAALRSASGDKRVPPKRASKAYVSAVFDAEAVTFDVRAAKMRYALPAAVAAMCARRSRPCDVVLDVGCGTGLAGLALREAGLVGRRMVGLDLAKNMCAEAAARRLNDGQLVYDDVELGDAEDGRAVDKLLAMDPDTAGRRFDVVVAADVFASIGDLGPALRTFHAALAPGGDAVFSCEDRPAAAAGETGWRLERSGRYTHAAAYVREAAAEAGFVVVEAERAVVHDDGPDATLYRLHKSPAS
ncbi:S-adenosyl-L-methionine-dependent methyltransferase [Pelagophyceae sp. CCMP2097]|nr:S-adenosyl-L-methionine-dependent methyltransferase [Pelagophyceae sp. CCMP2097]